MVFDMTAQNGTTFANPVGTTFPWLVASTLDPIGTCTIVTSTLYRCQPSTTGQVGIGDGLVNGDAQEDPPGLCCVAFNIPASQAQGSTALHLSWNDSAGETGNADGNDVADYVVAGFLEVPSVNAVMLGGAGGGLMLVLAAAYVLHRRRRPSAAGLTI